MDLTSNLTVLQCQELREGKSRQQLSWQTVAGGENTEIFYTFKWRDNSAKGRILMPATKSFSNSLKMLVKLESLIRAGFNYLRAMLKHSRDKPHLLSGVW